MHNEREETTAYGRYAAPLTVYKASAGSGKTFTLATEYIKLLAANPQSYRTILAVTFTNKATREMKDRIVSQLYGIAHGCASSRSYAAVIMRDTGMDVATLRMRAGTALRLLLHDYSRFRVETIDTFFQSVLRNMARELDLTANLRVELEDVEVERQAVDRLIEGLSPGDKELRWITDYIDRKISDGEGWDVIRSIKSFGENIFKDVYQREGDRIMEAGVDDALFNGLLAALHNERTGAESVMKAKGDAFFRILDEYGLSPDNFVYGEKGVAGFFRKLRDGNFSPKNIGSRVLAARDDAEAWVAHAGVRRRAARRLVGSTAANALFVSTALTREAVVSVVEERLRPLLAEALVELPVQWRRRQSALAVLRNINELRLLGSIERVVREIDDEACRFLLCHTQHLLSSMVGAGDAPFIYEKTGCRTEHIMIDEFQDTSTTQWANFKVLLRECMSHKGNSSLVVGDIKQSIYRWRDGDWRLLANISREWGEAGQTVAVSSLDTNYRSRGNIVSFNNAFFREAALAETLRLRELDAARADTIMTAYADVEQKTQEDKRDGGRVEITILPRTSRGRRADDDNVAADDDNADNADKTAAPDVLECVAATVERLIAAGARQSDIAILVRENRRVGQIAEYFAQRLPDVRLVSDEAFRLDASDAVNIIMDAVRVLAHPDDGIARAALTTRWLAAVEGRTDTDDLLPRHTDTRDDTQTRRTAAPGTPLRSDGDTSDDRLPAAFTRHTDDLRVLPLTELTERLYDIFRLSTLNGQGAYINTFHDCLREFLQDMSGGIDTLTDYWDDTMRTQTISCDDADGVRIMTIHKSKGLEFESVIVPFCDWRMSKPGLLWCKSDEQPYCRLPLIPVRYDSGLADTVFADYYIDETVQNAVDNLNLLYVAFTRAAANLFVFCEDRGAASRQQLITDCLKSTAERIGAQMSGGGDNGAVTQMTFGDLYIDPQKDDEHADNVFLRPSVTRDVCVETFCGNVAFRQSNDSRRFVADVGDEAQQQQDTYIKTGALLHATLARIATTDDIDAAIAQMDSEGLFGAPHDKQRIADFLRDRLTTGTPREWFDNRWTLFNECAILTVDPDTGDVVTKRPDRVMSDGTQTIVVDYKFGKPRPEYVEQVRNYMRLIRDMGKENVSGYLWFVYSNDIVEVNA